MTEEECKNIKSLIRAVLMSSKEGVEASRLLGEYQGITGEQLPWRKFGYQDVTSFMRSVPDVVRVITQGNGQTKFFAVADQSTAHIQKLIANQKRSKKLKKPFPKQSLNRPMRPVGTGQPRQNHRPPLLGRYPGDPNHRQPPPFDRQGRVPPHSPAINFRVTVGGDTGQRAVNQTGKTIPKTFGGGAYRDGNSSHYGKSSYQVPPRFQKTENYSRSPEEECWDVSSPESVELERPPLVGKWHEEPFESEDFLQLLEDYCELNRVNMTFSLQPTKFDKGYICVIHIHDKSVGRINIFETELQAKEEAAKNVCKQFNITHENKFVKWGERNPENKTTSPSSVPANIKDNIRKLLSMVEVSMWATRFPVAYKEKFGVLPDQLMEMVKCCTDVARVEMEAAANREVIYPVRGKEESAVASTELSGVGASGGLLRSTNGAATTTAAVKPSSPQGNPFEGIVIPPSASLGFKEERGVYMSYAESCDFFCVQFDSDCCEEMNSKLQLLCPNLPRPNRVNLKPGVFCSALYSVDLQWYRAQVLSDVHNNRVRVRFVDYGNEDEINADDIRPLPSSVLNVPQQVINCSLYGIQPIDRDKWSGKSLEILGEFARDQELIAVSLLNNDGVEAVELYQVHKREKSLNDLLVEKKEARRIAAVDRGNQGRQLDEPDELELPDERFWDVYVSSINDEWKVIVRIVGEDYSERLEIFEAELESYYNSSKRDQEIRTDMICVANIEGLYHRVKVRYIQNNKAECYILDHGDVEEVDVDHITPLDPKFNQSLPYQAIKMELYGLSNMMYEKTTQEKLVELAIGKICVAEVIEREEKITAVLFDMLEGELNINEHIVKVLISEGHALDLDIFNCNHGDGSNQESQNYSGNQDWSDSPEFRPKSRDIGSQDPKVLTSASDPTNFGSGKGDGVNFDQTNFGSHSRDSFNSDRTNFGSNSRDSFNSESRNNSNSDPNVLKSASYPSNLNSDSGNTLNSNPSVSQSSSNPTNLKSESQHNFNPNPKVQMFASDQTNLGSESRNTVNSAANIASHATNFGTQSRNDINQDPNVLTNASNPTNFGSESRNNITPNPNVLTSASHATNSESNLASNNQSLDESLTTSLSDLSIKVGGASGIVQSETSEETPPLAKIRANSKIPGKGDFLPVRIIWMEDPSYFACIPIDEEKKWTEFADKLNDHYQKDVLEEEEPIVGEIYAGEIDQVYHRVIVSGVQDDKYCVYLPDKALYSILEKENFQPLRKQFLSFPFLAFKAKLHGLRPTGDQWCESAKYLSIQTANSKSLFAYICGEDDNGVVPLKLIDTTDEQNDVCLDEVLLESGYAIQC